MITIHYRPLAFRRLYESVCLPIRPTLSWAEQVDEAAREIADDDAETVVRRRGQRVTHRYAVVRDNVLHVYTPRPDPLGDAVARGPRPRARTTTEIPIAVDATLPAIASALERLRTSLGRNGTAAQILAVEAIAKAVDRVTGDLIELHGLHEVYDVPTLRRITGREG